MAVTAGRQGQRRAGLSPSGPWAKALLMVCSLLLVLVAACSPMPLMVVAFGGAASGAVAGQLSAPSALSSPTASPASLAAAAWRTPTALPAEEPMPTATPLLPTALPAEEPMPTATPLPPTALPAEEPMPTATPLPPTALPTEPPPPTAVPLPSPVPAETAVPLAPPPPAAAPPDHIVAPAIGLDAPVVEMGYQVVHIDGVAVTGWQVPRDEAAFHQGSAYPGHVGNTVVSGHNNVGRQVFRALGDLSVGDVVQLHVGEAVYQYAVSQREVVRESGASYEERVANGRWILPTADERLTLVTCYPYPASTHRLIIVALPLR